MKGCDHEKNSRDFSRHSSLKVNRTALDNALESREAEIAQLREDLAALDLDDLTDAQIEAAVAVRLEADDTLTVFVD